MVTIDDQPWFVGYDVAKTLELSPHKSSYAHHWTSKTDVDERRSYPRSGLGLPPGKPMILLSESGLYKLIMRSDKPQAKVFQDWVTKEVPSPNESASLAV